MGILNKRREFKVYNNLSKKGSEALTEQKKMTPALLIKPADKAGAICKLKRADYIKEVER